MKKTTIQKFAYFVIAVVIVLFSACDPEKEPAQAFPVVNGSFQVNGSVYATNYATLTNDINSYIYDSIIKKDTVINNKDTIVDIHFPIVKYDYSQKLTLSNVDYNQSAKEVYTVLFRLEFPDSGSHAYSYLSREDTNYSAQENFYMPYCAYTSNGKVTSYSKCNGGILSVSGNKESYSFTYELVFDNSVKVSGSYNGKMNDFVGIGKK